VEAPTDTPVLPYGVEPLSYKRRRRIIVLAILLLIAIFAAKIIFRLLQPYWLQAVYLRHQNHIAHQVLPAGTVIYTEDPARIAALRTLPDYRDKHLMFPPTYDFLPPAWERAYSSETFPARDPGSTQDALFQVDDNFGYTRTSSGGKPWIVRLDQVNPWKGANGRRMVGLTQGAFAPVGWTPGTRAIDVSYMSRQILLNPDDRITLFAPQPDPTVPSRINVPYELNGQSGVLKATVTDNGYVDFTNDSGPATVVKWNDWGGDPAK
jgi:hypothetical protein